MTTSVDILFKELPAPARAVERTTDLGTSIEKVGRPEKRSNMSNDKNDKTFPEHLDDHHAVSTNRERKEEFPENSATTRNSGKYNDSETSIQIPSPSKNDQSSFANVEESVTDDNGSKKQNTSKTFEIAMTVPEIEKSDKTEVITNSVEGTKTNSSSERVNLSEHKKVAVDTSSVTNILTAHDDAGKNNIYGSVAQGRGAANNSEQVIPAATNAKTINPIANPVNGKPVPDSPSDNSKSSVQPSDIVTNSTKPNDVSTAIASNPQITIASSRANAQVEAVSKEGAVENQSSTEQFHTLTSGNVMTTSPDKNQTTVDPQTVVTASDAPEIIISNVEISATTATQAQFAVKKAAPEVAVAQNVALTAAAIAQGQAGNQNTAAINKNGSSKNNSSTATAKSSGNIAANGVQASSSSKPTLNNAVKSDILLPMDVSNQRLDQLLPQNSHLNGQPNLLSGSVLGAQEININKNITNLSSLVKPEASITPKMINEQISVAISKNITNGQNNFSISLKPAELGQVDIRIEFMADGKMQASMSVESEKTLTMLQRDQASLEKALQDAGINLTNKNLNFSLMKQGDQNNGQKFAGFNGSVHNENIQDEMSNMASMQEVRVGYSNQAIDISV